jgi:hypothetical protein
MSQLMRVPAASVSCFDEVHGMTPTGLLKNAVPDSR